MKVKVQAGTHPWIDSWNILINNSATSASYTPHAVPVLVRGTGNSACASENYWNAYWDTAAAYQLSLRWLITGDNSYANAATNILNQWANTCTNLCGDPNVALLSIYGYQFACAAENLRGYTNWAAGDFTNFQSWMLNQWYPLAHSFLAYHQGTCNTYIWANWDLCSMNSLLAIGVLCDRRDIYNEAINYFKTGVGNGAAGQLIFYTHPGYMGQWQEAGRDQGHCTLGPALMGTFCEIAWNQGDDIYGYNTNEFLAGCEYVAKFNAQPLTNTVPYVAFANCNNDIQPSISTASQGTIRPGWDLVYNHYANRKGLAAAYTAVIASQVRPEGGGGNYGPNSGGYDQLGFTTLTHTLDAIPTNAVPAPSGLNPEVRNNAVTLSWWGSGYAAGYNVKRATAAVGPYVTIASVTAPALSYVDIGLAQGTTYYYTVSAVIGGVETTNSNPVAAAPNLQLSGTVIGSSGSYNNLGASKECVFDGALGNFYDAAHVSGDWAGLDLGRSNLITQVAYCPRPNFAGRMVGGMFQGANVPDFSSGVVTLFTISAAPPDTQPGTLTYQTIANPNAFRYVRYVGPSNGSCNVAEVKFFGAPPGSAPPVAPGNLLAVAGNTQVALSWMLPDTTMSFNLKRSTIAGGPYSTVATGLATTNYADTGLTNWTTYYYVVSAVNGAGESADSTPASAMPSDLVAYYKLDETSGTVANDFSGKGNNGTLMTGATRVPGVLRNAVHLDGTTNAYVTLPAGVVRGLTDFSVTAWVKVDTNATWARVFDFGSGTGTYMFLAPASGGNTVRYAITIASNGGEQQLNSSSILSPRAWHYLAVTLSGTVGRLYIDGGLVAVNAGMTLNPSSLGITRSNYVGKSQWADPCLNGTVDDFRIYTRALSSAEVLSLSRLSPNLAFSAGSNQMQLNWAAVFSGWQLQAQTNDSRVGLATNWVAVPSSTNVSQFTLPIIATNGSVFFRLAYP